MPKQLGLSLCLALLVSATARAEPDFDKSIAPLLVRHCLDCHSGPKPKGKLDLTGRKATFAGGKNGPAVVAGKPEGSPLWQRVEADEMPPRKPLTAAEKKLLKDWIVAGARWGTDPIDPFRLTTDKRAGYDWWSLQPVTRPTLPAVKDRAWPRNAIDHFVLAALEANGLQPSPAAERRVLIRRLSFDLLGLPPAPKDVEAFVKDAHPRAYEKLVDRLLESPHYGERWARHWLDVVRFGESNGFERDLPRPDAWPYRDWVIKSLDDDMPYDEFVRLQLAGDVLRPHDSSALKATGFLVAGAHDTVFPASDKMRAAMRQDELEDVVATVGQTFLGLTVNCARCHDHKFDPITQKDYYRLASALAGVQHGERNLKPEDGNKELAKLQEHVRALEKAIAAIDEPVKQAILAERRKNDSKPVTAKPLAEWDFRADLKDRIGELHGTRFGEAKMDKTGLVLDGKTGFVSTEPIKKDLREKTLEAWVQLAGLNQRGGGVMGLETPDGVVFDSIVFGEQEPKRWMAGSNFFKRTQSFGAPDENKADNEVVHIAISYAADGTITAYRNGVLHGKPYKSSGVATFKAGEGRVIFGVRHEPAGGNRMLAGTIVRARLYDRALGAEEVAASAGVRSDIVAEADVVARLSAEIRARRERLAVDRQQAAGALAKLHALSPTKVYAVVPQQPEVTQLLIRGNVGEPSEVVAPGGIPSLAGIDGDFHLKPDAPEGERRKRLAEWITDGKNPLFRRVMVNRLWHHHFGAGLVETTNDFGFSGGRPSHPQLLDWLAADLTENKGSLKALHRTIVLSATYRQASLPREAALAKDAGNRLLWRRSPQRLEAESVRDTMLAVAGRLDPTVGGQGYQDFKSHFFRGTQFYDPIEQIGPAFHRRTIYRMWARGGRSPFLDTFDCPDPSTTTPRRAVTTTPLQALTLMNNAFVLHMAEQFALRLKKDAGDDVDAQIDRAFALAYGRPPSKAEAAQVRPFVARHGLSALGRVLFNSNEFIYVD
ncbi:MAG: DUF1553 domain-containing protein [Gemmataceae bacterium]|nr:DUF1553 domain-containing protein [Gemmataceae bacterium]